MADSDSHRGLRQLGDGLRFVRAGAGTTAIVMLIALSFTGLLLGLRVVLIQGLIRALDVGAGYSELDVRAATGWIVGLAVITMVNESSDAMRPHARRVVEARLLRAAELQLLHHVAKVPYRLFESEVFHDQVSRARRAVARQPAVLIQSLASMVMGGVTLIATLGFLAFVSPLAALMLALAATPLLVASLRTANTFYVVDKEFTGPDRLRTQLVDLLIHRVSNLEIRTLGATGQLNERVEHLWEERQETLERVIGRRLYRSVASGLAAGALLLVATAIVLFALISGTLDLAGAAAAAFAVWSAAEGVRALSHGLVDVREATLFLADLHDLGDVAEASGIAESERLPSVSSAPGGAAVPVEAVHLDDVSFRYPDGQQTTLQGLSMTFRRGRVTAIVGPSGVGKTTTLKLLAGLHDPVDGEISAEPRAAGRPATSIVLQDFVRYPLSVTDNIALGDVHRARNADDIRAAARAAGAAEFIDRLPAGYDTILSTEFAGGAELSVGQWQRIAIARAIFSASPVLALDEPTSSLDPRTEARVYDTLRELADDRIVVIVSHRYSIAALADWIYLVSEHGVIEEGTHRELVGRRGRYADLFQQELPMAGQELVADG